MICRPWRCARSLPIKIELLLASKHGF
jgi:hypothetical protein